MSAQTRRWGAIILSDDRVRFRLWAPEHAAIKVRLCDRADDLPMTAAADGWHELITNQAGYGTQYRYVLPDGRQVPDPASAYQPQDVSGPSEVIDTARYRWTNETWTGRHWHQAIVYELHVGAFTPAGTFRAAMEKLPHLAALGVTAVELMPIADFAGTRNWGYDGVLPYAPDSTYGRPEDLQALIDAAHGLGLMVILDVVYNHFGPEGNYLHAYAPAFFTERHKTPWGAGINFDGQTSVPVRQFFIDNALYWLTEYRFDGLRLDAVHAIADDSPEHIIDEIARVARAHLPHRHVHLILENEHNEAHRIERNGAAPTRFTAQWNDDVHHVLHTAATGERAGYYADYHSDIGKLARALAEGFAFQGEQMNYRGSTRGEPSAHLPPEAFIAFIQNHDQIGNRAFGDRLSTLASPQAMRAIAAVYLLLPQVPMLFMGEEWATSQPFPFFCDFHGDLAQAVREGRRNEFARFPQFADPSNRERIPDPLSPHTFASAKLRWNDIDQTAPRATLDWYKTVIAVRTREIIPRLCCIQRGGEYQVNPAGAIRIQWTVNAGEQLVLVANLTDRAATSEWKQTGRIVWCEGESTPEALMPWTVQWSLARSLRAGHA